MNPWIIEKQAAAGDEEAQQWLVDRRIACPEAGYPVGEARYANAEEWEKANDV